MTDWTGRKRSSETLCRGGWLLVERVYQEGWASPAAQPQDVLVEVWDERGACVVVVWWDGSGSVPVAPPGGGSLSGPLLGKRLISSHGI